MSGHASYEDSALIRAGLLGAACGLSLVAAAYAIAGHLVERVARHRPATEVPSDRLSSPRPLP